MWDSGLKYGKIAELFLKFHYNSTRSGTARPYSDMTNKTLKHRKDFIKDVLDVRDPPTPFPLSFDDPDAQLCASMFLEENRGLFEVEPGKHVPDGVFKYPADTGEVINVLAKIICTQEVMYHRNQMHAEARKVNKDETIAVAAPYDDIEVRESLPTTTPPPPKARPSTEEQIQEFESNILPGNIRINLNAAYPLEAEPPFTESQWLFETGSYWPEELQAFTFRWLHEHKAYHLHPAGDHIRNFVTALKRQVNLPLSLPSDQEVKIYNKANKYLGTWVRTWQQCGLLVHKGDEVQRHRELEKALNIRRAKYIAIVQNGRPEGPGMLTPTKIRNTAASLKRNGDGAEDSKREMSEPKRTKPDPDSKPEFEVIDLLDYTETRPVASTSKRSFGPPPVEPQPSFSPSSYHAPIAGPAPAPVDPYTSIYPPKSTNSPFDPARTSTPTPAPALPFEVSSSADTPDPSLPFRYVPPLPPGNIPRIMGDAKASTKRQSLPPQKSATNEANLPNPADTTSRRVSAPFRPLATEDLAANSDPLVESNPSIQPIPIATSIEGSVLQSQSPQPQTPATPDTRPGQSKPAVPTLYLIVEKAEGSLNSDYPLSENDLRSSSLPEFFDKVASRRQNPDASVTRLRLVQRWGAKTNFLVERSTTDEQWKKIRSDIRRNFSWQSEKKAGKTRFEVYVSCEGDGPSSDDEEEY